MTHPIIVGILSIIPGLGFLLFRRYRQAVFMFVLVVGSFLFSVFSPWEGPNEFFIILSIVLWIMQISMAVRMAQAIKSSNHGITSASIQNPEEIHIPADLSSNEKRIFRVRETLRQQLEFGEKLVEGIHATRGTYGGYYYIGLSDKNLVILELDFLSRPMYVNRIKLSDVEKVQHKKGIINDSIVFFLRNSKPMKFQISFPYKDHIYPIIRELGKRTYLHKES